MNLLTDAIYRLMADEIDELNDSELLAKLDELESEVLILSGNSVLNIHGKLKSALNKHEDGKILADLLQQLIKSIRRDLGNGPVYDDSKLMDLISSGHVENTDSSGTGITR